MKANRLRRVTSLQQRAGTIPGPVFFTSCFGVCFAEADSSVNVVRSGQVVFPNPPTLPPKGLVQAALWSSRIPVAIAEFDPFEEWQKSHFFQPLE
jgi:hypothetical protein